MITPFKVGEVVRHDYSHDEVGTVTELRDDEYSVYVKWDSQPELNDWYKPENLVTVRGAVSPMGNPFISLEDVGKGAIGKAPYSDRA